METHDAVCAQNFLVKYVVRPGKVARPNGTRRRGSCPMLTVQSAPSLASTGATPPTHAPIQARVRKHPVDQRYTHPVSLQRVSQRLQKPEPI